MLQTKKEFTLDFSKWCVGQFTRMGLSPNSEKACAYQQARNAGITVDDNLMSDVIQVNDSRISRKEKIRLMKAEFKKSGITMKVKNANYGMPKSC